MQERRHSNRHDSGLLEVGKRFLEIRAELQDTSVLGSA
jgi:hypothetical protein